MYSQLTLPSGNAVRCFDSGGDKPPVILLHGLSNSIEIWDRVIPTLARAFRVLAFDLLGFGQSDRPDAAYDSAFYLRELSGFLDAVGLKRAHLVGNSLGGGIVLRFAAAQPDRVASAAIAAPGGFGRQTNISMMIATLPVVGYALARPSSLNTSLTLRMVIHDPKHRTEELHRLMTRYGRMEGGHRAFHRALRSGVGPFGVIGRDRFAEAARQVTCPMLVLWGRQDRVFPYQQSKVAMRLLPTATHVPFDRCGHYPQWECADAFAEAVMQHVTGASQQEEIP